MFSSVAIRHISAPRGRDPLKRVTHLGEWGVEGDGPFMVIELTVENGAVEAAHFRTMGCPSSIACGSLICELVTGRSVDRLRDLCAKDLVTILGGLPEGKEYCAKMAAEALQTALSNEVS